MRVFGSSFRAWESLERQEGTQTAHGLVFPLAVVAALVRELGVTVDAEEHVTRPEGHDAIWVTVLDARCLLPSARLFRQWGVPYRWRDRRPVGRFPLVWMGGQGLRNPRPMGPVADLIVMGDAEPVIGDLVRAWQTHGDSEAFLDVAAAMPGVWVPDRMPAERHEVQLLEADDISITLRQDVRTSLDGTRRVELARGCRSKCTFCSLGWRTAYRENAPEAVIGALEQAGRRVHLQAGDAASYSGLPLVQTWMREHGGIDQGWTGRLDATLDNPDADARATKRYAFGVEAASARIRAAVGKPHLTDDYLADGTISYMSSMPRGTVGRALWHMITGWPTEASRDMHQLGQVLRRINDGCTERRKLTLNWQPLQPLPGTPSQWLAGGTGARRMRDLTRVLARGVGARLIVEANAGRTDDVALICSALARADERGADLLEAMVERRVSVPEAVVLCGQTHGALDPDAALPWAFVRTRYDQPALRRAHEVMLRRLGAP